MIPTTKILFFTTFNDRGYDLYGKAWIKTFIAQAEKNNNICARIYYENFVPDIQHDSIEYVKFADAIPHHSSWIMEYFLKTQHKSYTQNMTVRFSHKAFVIQHALKNTNTGYVIWLDGDCVFKDADYSNFPETLIKDKFLACQIEYRTDTVVKHVESGILVFNPAHSDKQAFLKMFEEFYQVDHIIQMPNDNVDHNCSHVPWADYGPYDGFILHKTLMSTGTDFIDLNELSASGEFTGDPEATFLHPELKSRFVHNIGHDGKNLYTDINRDLNIDDNFTWTYEDTNNMTSFLANIAPHIEIVGEFHQQEFPFTIHHPKVDLVVSRHIYEHRSWEPHISDIILQAMKPEGIFVDIGANVGWHSRVVQNAGYDIEAFEPMPSNYKVLQLNCEKTGSTLHNLGLGDQPGTMYMNNDPHNYGNSYIDNCGTVPVDIVRLDDMFDSTTIQRINAVKIDVQRYEAKVIQGGKSFFSSLQPGTVLIIEINPFALGRDLKHITTLLSKSQSSYAICFWGDNGYLTEMPVLEAIQICLNPSEKILQLCAKENLEFDMVITL